MAGSVRTEYPHRKPSPAPGEVGSSLPLGIGRVTPGWLALVVAAGALSAWGLYAYSRQLAQGEVVTGMRDWGTMGGAPWGLYIVFVVYFVGVSFAGITIAAIIRLARIEYLKPIGRAAELLTVIAITLGAFAIVADLGQPGRGLMNLFRYARPQSPFFGTFTLVVSGYLVASFIYLFLDGRRDAAICAKKAGKLQWFHRLWASGYKDTEAERERHRRASFGLAVGIIPLLITAHSTLGFVFGLQGGRPGWFSALQAPSFVILAGVSGMGLLIIIAAALRAAYGHDKIDIWAFRWMGLFLLVLLLSYLYFVIVEILTMTYSAGEQERAIMMDLLVGRYATLYWGGIALLVAPLAITVVLMLRKDWSVPWLVVAGVCVTIAAVLKRFVLVVPSLTSGGFMPYGQGSYAPTWVEYGVVGGLIGLGVLAFVVFMKVFPIMPVQDDGGEA